MADPSDRDIEPDPAAPPPAADARGPVGPGRAMLNGFWVGSSVLAVLTFATAFVHFGLVKDCWG